MSSSEMDAFKDIPGYKAILKSVLKSQIQLLIEQLADQTGEESIILTASINDGTLSHLGSSTGKGFLEGRDEMKSQFLGYCLKTHHRKKTQETKSPPYQRSNQRHSPYRTPAKQSRVHPVSLQKARSVDNSSAVMQDPSVNIDPNKAGGQIKQEEDEQLNRETPDFSSTPTSFPSSLQLSHTQTSADLDTSGQGNSEGQGQSGENVLVDSDETSNSATNIKIEPITENDMELEITGVEPGNTSLTQEDWGQGSVGYGSAGADGDSSVNQSGETSNYNSDQQNRSSNLQPPSIDLTGDDDEPAGDITATDPNVFMSGFDQGFSLVDVKSLSAGDQALDPNIPQFLFANTAAGGQLYQVKRISTADQSHTGQKSQTKGRPQSSNQLKQFRDADYNIPRGIIPADYNIPSGIGQGEYNIPQGTSQIDYNIPPGPSQVDYNIPTGTSQVDYNIPTGTSQVDYNIPTGTSQVDYNVTPGTSHTNFNMLTDVTGYTFPKESKRARSKNTPSSLYSSTRAWSNLRIKRAMNPLKSVRFNRDFYGIRKSKICLKRYICDTCGRRLMTRCDLERHFRVHTGEKPFKCPYCNISYAQKSTLYLHLRKGNCMKSDST